MSDELQVRRDIQSPPGGWRYTVPETGVTLTGEFFKTLYQSVRLHRNANGLPEMAREEIEDGACRETNPGGMCGARPKKPHALVLPHLTLAKADSFIRSIMGALRDRKFVSLEEAQRRYDICSKCLILTDIGGCKGCSGAFKIIEKVMPHNPLPPHPEGKDYCGACGCVTRLKAWLPNETLDRAEKVKPKYLEGHCWRLPENRSASLALEE